MSKGLTVLGISIPYISTYQSPLICWDSSRHIISKIRRSGVGAIIAHGDGLYLYSEEPAWTLKIKHQRLLEEHKRGYLKLIQKDVSVIPSAFTFTTWNQMVLDCENFQSYLAKIRESYSKDPVFQEYVREDIESSNRSLTEVTLGYLLEEVLLDYLVAHGLVNLPNEYVRNHEKCILNCYHGKPHRSHVYFHQKNPFGIKSTNTFRNSWYDLKKKKLYDFDRLNIETFDFSR